MTYKKLQTIIKKPLKIGEPEELSVGNYAPAGKKGKEWVAQHKVQRNRYAMDDGDEKTNRFNAKDVFADEPTNPRLPSSVDLDHVFPNAKVGGTVNLGRDVWGVDDGIAKDGAAADFGEEIEEKRKLKPLRHFINSKNVPNLDSSETSPLESEQFEEGHFEKMDAEADKWNDYAKAHGAHADAHHEKARKAWDKKKEENPEKEWEEGSEEAHHHRMGRGHDKCRRAYQDLASCCKGKEVFEAEEFVEQLEQLDEFTFKLNPKKKGMFKGKSIKDIKKSEKHDTGTKKKEDVFAINAKHHFHKEEEVISKPSNPKIDKKIGSQPFGAGKKPAVKTPGQDCAVKEGFTIPFGGGDGSLDRLRHLAHKSPDAKIGSVAFGAGKGGVGGAGKKPECPTPDAKIGSVAFGAGTTLKHKAPGQHEETVVEGKKDKKSKKDCDGKSPPVEGFQEEVTSDCGKVVKDFVHSKNKKGNPLNGDSKKERIHRALGACYAKKKGK